MRMWERTPLVVRLCTEPPLSRALFRPLVVCCCLCCLSVLLFIISASLPHISLLASEHAAALCSRQSVRLCVLCIAGVHRRRQRCTRYKVLASQQRLHFIHTVNVSLTVSSGGQRNLQHICNTAAHNSTAGVVRTGNKVQQTTQPTHTSATHLPTATKQHIKPSQAKRAVTRRVGRRCARGRRLVLSCSRSTLTAAPPQLSLLTLLINPPSVFLMSVLPYGM